LWGIENGESWEVDWIKKIKNIWGGTKWWKSGNSSGPMKRLRTFVGEKGRKKSEIENTQIYWIKKSNV
jgi:hypothetical protein